MQLNDLIPCGMYPCAENGSAELMFVEDVCKSIERGYEMEFMILHLEHVVIDVISREIEFVLKGPGRIERLLPDGSEEIELLDGDNSESRTFVQLKEAHGTKFSFAQDYDSFLRRINILTESMEIPDDKIFYTDLNGHIDWREYAEA